MTLTLNELIRARKLSRYCLSKALQISVEELLLLETGNCMDGNGKPGEKECGGKCSEG